MHDAIQFDFDVGPGGQITLIELKLHKPEAGRQVCRQVGKQVGTQVGRQAKQAGRQAGRNTGRQTNKYWALL